ncbi:sugar ABC transporter ATP-binding protein, partial [Aureimonas flava]
FVHVKLDTGETITARSPGDFRVRHGDPVWLTPEDGRMHRFDANGAALR